MNDIELLSHKLSYLRDYVRHLEQKGNPAVKHIFNYLHQRALRSIQ
jgi:hypothetical protein